jgi:iron complex outermembrane receptor protein
MLKQLYPGRLACALPLAWLAWVACAPAAMAQPADLPGDPSEADYPVVITPTRLRQSLADVPGSVTVITAETIRRYGIQSVPEALRLVPGMAVSRASGNDYRISFHGTNGVAPRRMNVLVDGVSVYHPGFAQVDWLTLPVALEDIDRIEVLRGPDSATYGPNSMTAVISILSKHPKDVEPALVSVSAAAHNMVDTTVRLAGSVGATNVRATANVQHDSGYDGMSLPGGGHDGSRVKRLNVRAQRDLADGSALDMHGSFVDSQTDVGFLDTFQQSYPDRSQHDSKFSVRWTKPLSANHEIQIEAFRADAAATQSWTACWPTLFYTPQARAFYEANRSVFALMVARGGLPKTAQEALYYLPLLEPNTWNALLALGPSALTPACGKLDQSGSESRTQIELQDTYVWSNSLRFVGGLGMRYQRADSESYVGGVVSNNVHWAFGHVEYRPAPWLTANVGGYGETNTLSGGTFSPRLALNAKLTDSQAVRAVFSKGTRTPDLFEAKAYWHFTATNLTPTVNGASSAELAMYGRGNGDLGSERISSRELGYVLSLRDMGLTLDARVFDDRLSGLVSNHLSIIDFSPSNADAVRLTGAELQASWELSRTWSGFASYAYLLNRHATVEVEASQYARHSGAVGLSHALSDTWRASVAHYAASGNGSAELGYGRTDVSLSHSFVLAGKPGTASLGVNYLYTPTVNTYQGPGRYFSANYSRSLGFFGQLRVAL